MDTQDIERYVDSLIAPETEIRPTDENLPPGNLSTVNFGELREFQADPRGFIWQRYEAYGRIFASHIGRPTAFIMGPEANELFLSTRNDGLSWAKALPLPMQKMLIGPNAPSPAHTFALEEGQPMRQLKQIAATAFHPETLARNLEVMNGYFAESLRHWSSGTCDFYEESKANLFKAIWTWITGLNETPAQYAKIETVYKAFTAPPELMKGVDRKKLMAAKHMARLALEKYVEGLIAQRHRQPREDVLSQWIHKTNKQGQSFTDRQTLAHAILFMITGDEATAITLCWVLMALHDNPAVLAKVRDEVASVVGDGDVTFEHTKQLTYTLNVLKEVERMYSPAFGPVRNVSEPFELDGRVVPKGWNLRICNFVSHHLPEVWDEPEKFDPDRFAPPREEDKRTPYSLVGFGAGPRVCVGKPWATMAMSAFVAHAVRGYDLEIPPHQDLAPQLIRNALFVPASGLQIQFRARENG